MQSGQCYKQKFWLVNNFIKCLLSKFFPFVSNFCKNVRYSWAVPLKRTNNVVWFLA